MLFICLSHVVAYVPFQVALQETQIGLMEELDQVKKNHQRELEEASRNKIKALEEHQAKSDEQLAKIKGDYALAQSALEDERVAKQQALAQVAAAKSAATPPATPKPNGSGPTGVITKEDLHKLHQANNLKLSELEAEHFKALQEEREVQDALKKEKEDLANEVARKEMERAMYEDEANSGAEEIEGYVVKDLHSGVRYKAPWLSLCMSSALLGVVVSVVVYGWDHSYSFFIRA